MKLKIDKKINTVIISREIEIPWPYAAMAKSWKTEPVQASANSNNTLTKTPPNMAIATSREPR